MTTHREDTGYTTTERNKKRVCISDYGKKAEADKAREEVKKMLEQLRRELRDL